MKSRKREKHVKERKKERKSERMIFKKDNNIYIIVGQHFPKFTFVSIGCIGKGVRIRFKKLCAM